MNGSTSFFLAGTSGRRSAGRKLRPRLKIRLTSGSPGGIGVPFFPGADLVAVRRVDAFYTLLRHLRLRRQANRVVRPGNFM